ncbi:hypothetical protein D9757_011300 [Collybiopsis confluens]|uniref:ER lumen protein-retaining receptor n=1 Tax=Collybiopsis confluens TaxID=2823264 RepID=A0A8H5LST5_9AGAR|nr:hypothetical protein D9757_011300 [Collybiopsis confluens]
MIFYTGYAADMARFISISALIYKMHSLNTSQGVSLKTQILYSTVFIARYYNVFAGSISTYNTLGKLFFIMSTSYVTYLIGIKYRKTYNSARDGISLWKLIVPSTFASVILSLFAYYAAFGSVLDISQFHVVLPETVYSFSIFLEAVAMIPQIYMLRRIPQQSPVITSLYLITSGLGRFLYIPTWMYKIARQGGMTSPFQSGVVSYEMGRPLHVPTWIYKLARQGGMTSPFLVLGTIIYTILHVYALDLHLLRLSFFQPYGKMSDKSVDMSEVEEPVDQEYIGDRKSQKEVA